MTIRRKVIPLEWLLSGCCGRPNGRRRAPEGRARRVGGRISLPPVSDRSPGSKLFLAGRRYQALTLRQLTRLFAGPADCFAFFSRRSLRGLFVESPPLHLTENAFPLHLLLQRPESLIDVVVADKYLQSMLPSVCSKRQTCRWSDGID
jgi:hypothetical protein